jgi:hypothetical protein
MGNSVTQTVRKRRLSRTEVESVRKLRGQIERERPEISARIRNRIAELSDLREKGVDTVSSRVISKEVQSLIAAEMERRSYSSPNEVLVKAMEALIEQQQAIEGIRRGLADVKAGRVRSFAQANRELRRKYKFLQK